jgi:4-amino-4-deoxy-L-arabinose transferase-like glycosyltransferase
MVEAAADDTLTYPPPETKSTALTYWLTVALVAAGGLVLRVQTFTDSWTGVHNAWGGAFYGNVARNFLRYGYWTTSFAPVVNSGVVDPRLFNIYYHHPPLTAWFTSVSFLLFGVHEWSARLVPLVFSLATMALVFQFANAEYGKGAALSALVVVAVLPVEAYYAAHLDPNSSLAIFFTALAVEGYRRWLGSGRRRHFAIMLIAILLGCMTSWFTYLVIPGLVAHGWLIHRPGERRVMLARLWPLPAAALVIFVLLMGHRAIALSGGRPEVFDPLGERLVKRTVDFGSDRLAIMLIYLKQIWRLYTFPVVILSAAWFSYFVYALWRRRLRTADWCILIMWSYGVLYALAFPGHLVNHDFFVRTYVPGVAIACGVVVWRLASAVSAPMARHVVAGLVLAVVGTAGISATLLLYGQDDRTNGPTLREFSEAIAAVTTPRDPVLLPFNDAVMQYYVDRPMTFDLNTREKLSAAVATATGPYLIVVPERNARGYSDILAYLRERYPERRAKGLFMFQGGLTTQAR